MLFFPTPSVLAGNATVSIRAHFTDITAAGSIWVLMSLLLADPYAFYLEHRRCGELESEVTEGDPDWIVMTCTCGATIARRIPPDSP